ncbi:ubiquitin carboxyl-terminal hydrolase CYLD-like [Pezoporus wallicus]|uniref:ubiquitin carboxyl-terminal hydrolase CYLD-like n=1 Tax=Pezoporus wallicus TaxID=35540 RepID=UPI00254B350D|nr:ubiquitin carboxyl-terminal hydrolase CYLD-like [Pezoporus wallicus]XP_061303612.1 ubiquitin carboxyl-terminal hydrolase CYLD-like [Pezoporus flaviventris]
MTMTNLPPSSGDGNCYYILTEDCSYGSKLFQAGNLCFCSERSYLRNFSDDRRPICFLRVIMLDDSSTVTINMEILQPVSEKVASFLLAISSHCERLNCFLDGVNLEAALRALPGHRVMAKVEHQYFPGIIRYIGSIYRSTAVLSPFFFGVELQGEGENRGRSDGSCRGTEYFKCKKNCGIFLPFTKVQFVPDDNYGKQKPKADTEEVVPVKVGDAVSFYVDEVLTRGIAMAVYRKGAQWLVKICPEEEGTTDIFREIPLDSVVKENLQSLFMGLEPPNQMKQEVSESSEECDGGNSALEVNSMVQITLDKGTRVSGIIRWLGYLPQIEHKMAGVELDEDKGVSDGEWLGKYYFHCAPKRGLFVKLQCCQPDVRFQSSHSSYLSLIDYGGQEVLPQAPDSFPPLRNEAAVCVLRGRMKGIQGHCNSCYMDAALFSLFSCTSVVDSMLFKPFLLCDRNVQSILRDEIVNPLRRTGFVNAKSVMHLREQLTDKGQCSSFTNAEKDPEEFLNLIMHQVLGIDPLLKLQSGGQKEQDCYCYQIFMDKQEDLVVPDVQQLVERSFLSSDLKLVEIPSCFIIQMPRFGKEYKMFSKIIPSLELDITDLLLDSPRECCLCGDVATLECSECFKDKVFAATGLKQFCSSCSRQVHSHYHRKTHKPRELHIPEEFHTRSTRGCQQVPHEKMELFAVLCIETSHYVSFVKYGPENDHWMFFDSMADRHGGENGFNIPTVTLCPEVAKYLDLPLAVLALKQPRDMDGVAKRLFCDAYMYMYQSKKMALYK